MLPMAKGMGIIHAAGIHAGEIMKWERRRDNSAPVRDEMKAKLEAMRRAR